MTASYSTSEEWRKKGNQIYRSDNESLAFTIRQKRLEEAQSCYMNAVNSSVDGQELSSACKNTAVVSAKIAVLYKQQSKPALQVHVKHHYELALKHFAQAVDNSSCQNDDWLSKIYESLKTCFDDAAEWAAMKDLKERLLLTEKFVKMLPDGLVKADGYLVLTNMTFHQAVKATQDRKYKISLQHLADCYHPVEEAKRWLKRSPEIDTEIRVLEEDIFLQTCIAKGLQAKAMGDSLLKDTIEKQERLHMDMVWDVMDWYQTAIVLTRGNDVELEAEINTRQGYVYDKILKMRSKAYAAYMESMNLVQVLYPKNLGNTVWFKEASTFLEAYQQERLRREEQREEELKAPIKEKLKPELTKLEKQRRKDVDEVLDYIYKTWPPKNSAHKLETTGSLKRRVQKALQHYHPDSQDRSKHGMSWIVMAEEITKVLTEKYNRIKCVD